MVAPYGLVMLLCEHAELHLLLSERSVVSWSPVSILVPSLTTLLASSWRKWKLLGRCSLNSFLSATYILIYSCSHSSSFPLKLFSYFSNSSYTSMPLHTRFPLKWKPLSHCVCLFSSYSSITCHPFLGALPDALKQNRNCLLCALKPLHMFLYESTLHYSM